MRHLAAGGVHAAGDLCGRVGTPVMQPRLERGQRWWQNEYPDDVPGQRRTQVAKSLPINVERHVASGGKRPFHRSSWRSVAAAEHVRPFQHGTVGHHANELRFRAEVVVDAVLLAGTRRARGGTDG